MPGAPLGAGISPRETLQIRTWLFKPQSLSFTPPWPCPQGCTHPILLTSSSLLCHPSLMSCLNFRPPSPNTPFIPEGIFLNLPGGFFCELITAKVVMAARASGGLVEEESTLPTLLRNGVSHV